MIMSGDDADAAAVVIISFQPSDLKLFLSKKRSSLLVINASCINGAKNRIKSGDTALVHIRQSNKDVLCKMASGMLYLQSSADSSSPSTSLLDHMKKGCKVKANATKRIVIKADGHIGRNRKGERLIECIEVICIHDDSDTPYLPEHFEYSTGKNDDNPISLKVQRSKIFAKWLIDTYGKDLLCRGSGVLDVAGGNGETCRHLSAHGIPVTLLDPHPRCGSDAAFTIIRHPLTGDGSDLTSRNDDVGNIIRNCSFICGVHPDQATEPIVAMALCLNVQFAILPCCVMPCLFPYRVQKRHGDPVRSYSSFCQYLMDMAPTGEKFFVDHLPFLGRNKVIYRLP